MLLKYLVPLGLGLVLLISQASADSSYEGDELQERRDVPDDLDSAELFLRPVVVKYGHEHPGVYTWQGGSGMGQGWGVYQQKAQVMMVPAQQGGGGWGGWGKEKMKKKKVTNLS